MTKSTSIPFVAVLLLALVCCITCTNVKCGTVIQRAAPCLTYASGRAPSPSRECCTGLQQLAQNARTVDDRKAICRCLKVGMNSSVQDRFLGRIPGACNIRVGFPVSRNTDCERLH